MRIVPSTPNSFLHTQRSPLIDPLTTAKRAEFSYTPKVKSFGYPIDVCDRVYEPGDRLQRPWNLGNLFGNFTYNDCVGRRDPDFYRFKLVQASTVAVSWTNNSSGPMLGALLDRNGRVVQQSGVPFLKRLAPGRIETVFSNNLPNGTYYIRITTGGNKRPYGLKLTVI